jgi:hypothetical protein
VCLLHLERHRISLRTVSNGEIQVVGSGCQTGCAEVEDGSAAAAYYLIELKRKLLSGLELPASSTVSVVCVETWTKLVAVKYFNQGGSDGVLGYRLLTPIIIPNLLAEDKASCFQPPHRMVHQGEQHAGLAQDKGREPE